MDEARREEVKRRFGARLRTLRKARKLSQEAVALKAGLAVPMSAKWNAARAISA